MRVEMDQSSLRPHRIKKTKLFADNNELESTIDESEMKKKKRINSCGNINGNKKFKNLQQRNEVGFQNEKRKRGRPPLLNSVKSGTKLLSQQKNNSSNLTGPSSMQSNPVDQLAPANCARNHAHAHFDSIDIGNSAMTSKTSRPQVAALTHKILSILMVNDPLTLTEIIEYSFMPENASKDLLLSILEILHVLGFVTVLQKQTGLPSDTTNFTFYAISGLSRVPYPVEISRINEDIMDKIESNNKLKARNQELEALTLMDLSADERSKIFKEIIIKYTEESEFANDPLYNYCLGQLNSQVTTDETSKDDSAEP